MIKSKLFGLFSRKQPKYVQKPVKSAPNVFYDEEKRLLEIEMKSFSGRGCYNPMTNPVAGRSLSVSLALDYYARVQPVSSSIDKITEEITSLEPIIFDEMSEKFITDHPALDLLDVPNPFCKYSAFMQEVSNSLEVTGNAFIIASGNINRPPTEIFSVNPTIVELTQGKDGYVNKITVNSDDDTTVFVLKFFNVDGHRVARYINGNNREIYHIKNPNPYGHSFSPWGFSRLTPIVQEMEQLLQTNTHNLSQLVRGARLSLSIFPERDLTDEQFMQYNSQLQAFSAGASNAGSILMLQEPFTVKEMSMTNKDMDFQALKNNIVASIHTQLGVPLPLVMAEQMTLANMQAAEAQFYNGTVIPTANRIFCELTDLLMPRYGNDNLVITFDRRGIPALEAQSIDNVNKRASLNVMTDNEIRTEIGLEHVKGGDALYKPVNLIPIGTDSGRDSTQSAQEMLLEKMRAMKNIRGERVYSDDKILEVAQKYNIG